MVVILAELHTVVVTLPLLDTVMVGLKVTEVQPETVPVEQVLGVFVTVMVLV